MMEQEGEIIPETIHASDKIIRSLEAEFWEEKDDVQKRRLRFLCDVAYLLDRELRYFYWGYVLDTSLDSGTKR